MSGVLQMGSSNSHYSPLHIIAPMILVLVMERLNFLDVSSYDICFISERIKKLRKPKPWKHTQPITRAQLQQMRDEFWDTAPHYGGQKGSLSFFPFFFLDN